MRLRAPGLLAAGWAAVALAWVMANPPFAAPDEAAHYVRALGLGSGALVGEETSIRPAGLSQRQRDFVGATARVVEFPAGLAPLDPGCYIREPRLPAKCIDAVGPPQPGTATGLTIVGAYQPLVYLLPAGATRLAERAAGADRWGRIASLLPALAALALAAAVLWDPVTGGASLLGLMAAVTPMVLFCAASLTGSGLEIAAAIAFFAALLRVRRDAGAPPSWVWVGLAGAGALLALSRSASPAWLALLLALFVVLTGARAAGRMARRRRPAQVTLALLVVAVALNRAWEARYGADVVFSLASPRPAVRAGFEQLGALTDQLVIAYGYLEFNPPAVLVVAWLGLVLSLVAAAVAVSARRGRIVLAAAVAGAALVPVAFYVVSYRFSEFDVQGRHVLPVMVAIPLLAGEMLREGWERLPACVRGGLLVAVPVVAAAGQVLAWWWNGRRAAVGIEGPLWFAPAAQWSPPLGWAPWMALVVGGAALAAAAVGSAGTARPESIAQR